MSFTGQSVSGSVKHKLTLQTRGPGDVAKPQINVQHPAAQKQEDVCEGSHTDQATRKSFSRVQVLGVSRFMLALALK